MHQRILLTAGRLPFALELARSLARSGAEVFVADSYPVFVCQASNAIRKSFRVPSPQHDLIGFRRRILEIVRREKIDLLIPVSEEVLYLALFRSELANLCQVFFSDLSLLQTLHHKQRFADYAADQGLGTPQTQAYRGQSALPAFTQRPYIIKRNYSRAGCQVYFPPAGRHPMSYGVPPDGSWLLQEKAEGEAICSVSVLRGGRVALTRLYRPASSLGTVSVVFCRVENAAVEAWIEQFAASTGYEGLVSFDFFATAEQVVAIECNPRATSGLHLCEPQLLSAAILGQAKPTSPEPVRQRAQIVLGLLSAMPQIIRHRQLGKLLPDIVRARDVVFSWRDPLPLFFQLACYLYFFWRMLIGRQSLVACMMEGLEWNQDMGQPEAAMQESPGLEISV